MAAPGRKPGTPKTGGRTKGTPNRLTAALKDMILGALDAKGGQAYLEKQADENPVAFLSLLGKVLPTTLASDAENPFKVTGSLEIRAVYPKAHDVSD